MAATGFGVYNMPASRLRRLAVKQSNRQDPCPERYFSPEGSESVNSTPGDQHAQLANSDTRSKQKYQRIHVGIHNDFHPNSIRVSTHIHIRPDHTSMTKTTLLSTGLRRRRSRRCRRLCCSKTSNRMSLDTNTNCSYQYQNQHRYRYR